MDPAEQLKAADMNVHTATPDTTTTDVVSPELVTVAPLLEGPSPESPLSANTLKLVISPQESPFKASAAETEREFMLGQPMLPQDEMNVLPPACRKLHAAYMNLAKLKKDSIQVAFKQGDSFHDLLNERKFDIYFDDLFHFCNSKPIESAFLRCWTLHMRKKQENAHMGFLDAFMVSARNIYMNKETNLVRQYVIEVLQDQKDKDHVMFAYTQGDHWITVVIALRHNKVYYLDSLEGRRTFTPITEVLDGVFTDFVKEGVDDVFAKFAKTGEGSKLEHIFDCPCHKQPDGKSCGFYTMHHMELVADFAKTDDDLKNLVCPMEPLHPDVINGKRELVAIFINDEVINPGGEFFHVAVMSSSSDMSTQSASMLPTSSNLALEAGEHAKSPNAGDGGDQLSQRPQMDYRLLEAARNGDATTVIILLNAPEHAVTTTTTKTGDHVVVRMTDVGPTNNDRGIQEIEMRSTGHGGSSTPDDSAREMSRSIGGGPLGIIPPTSGRRLLQGVASDGDGLLHIAARFEHVDIVSAISSSRWRDSVDVAAKNNRGETALHCAAATGNAHMISALLTLLPKDGDKKRQLLREQKDTGETCLHEAVQCGGKLAVERLVQGDVDVFLEPSDGSELVKIRDEQGVSPLYLATTLRQPEIVKFLTRQDGHLGYPAASYDGPGGKTAMHAAVLLSKELCKCLADWNNELIDKADLSGNTPLHLLASTKETIIMELLLDADPSAGYRSDNEGSLPIHVAAASGSIEVLNLLCERRPGCSWSCNSLGQTILHIAVKNGSRDVVKYVCSGQKFARIFNTRDTGGNTALHLAVLQGDRLTFCHLMRRREVCLNFTNKEERTPLDLAQMSLPPGISILSGPRDWIVHTLLFAEADYGAFRTAGNVGELDKEKESETIGKSAGLVAVCAVLMLTTAFAAPFSVTDLYNKADASKAKWIAYHVFVMSDVVAFGLSTIAISCATLAGFSFTDRGTRFFILSAGVGTLFGAALFMIFVFAAGLYVAIGSIVHGHAFIAVSLLVSTCPIIALYLALAWTFLPYGLMLFSRFGFPRAWRVPGSVTDLHSLEQGWFPRVCALFPRQRQDRSPARHRGLCYLCIRAFPPPKIRIRI